MSTQVAKLMTFAGNFVTKIFFLLVLTEQSQLGELDLQMLINCFFFIWQEKRRGNLPRRRVSFYSILFLKNEGSQVIHISLKIKSFVFLVSERLKIDNSVTQDEDDGGEMINSSVEFGRILLKHS